MGQPAAGGDSSDPGWKWLYFTGGLAAVIMVVFFRRNCGAELMLSGGLGILDAPEVAPDNALDWFRLLQDDPFVGLTLFNIFDLINYLLLGLVFLALYGALRPVSRGAMLAAATTMFTACWGAGTVLGPLLVGIGMDRFGADRMALVICLFYLLYLPLPIGSYLRSRAEGEQSTPVG